ITAGIVAAISGFATSFALVIAGLQAVGASQLEASSGLLVLCLTVGIASIVLAWRYRMPISFAWSTPGAALLVAAGHNHANFAAAVGAFLVCAVLIVLCGLWPALGRARCHGRCDDRDRRLRGHRLAAERHRRTATHLRGARVRPARDREPRIAAVHRHDGRTECARIRRHVHLRLRD